MHTSLVSALLSPMGLPGWALMSFPVDEPPEGPVSSFFSSVFKGNMAILISRVSLQFEEVVYDTLFTQELPMTEVWWWWRRRNGRGAQIQAKKGPWLAICRALVSPSPLNTGTLFGHPNVMSETHGMVSPSSQNNTSLWQDVCVCCWFASPQGCSSSPVDHHHRITEVVL